MAVVYAREKRRKRFSTELTGGSIVRRGEKVFLVRVDDVETPIDEIEGAPEISLNDAFSISLPDIKCVSASTESVSDSGLSFEVTFEYSDENEGSDNEPEGDNRELSFTFEAQTCEIFKAKEKPTLENSAGVSIPFPKPWKFKNSIRASSGEKFDPSIEETFYDGVINFSRDEIAINFFTLNQYRDSINSDQFTITYGGNAITFAKGTVWMRNISANAVYGIAGIEKWRVSYEMVLREEGWKRKIQDQGIMMILNGDGPPSKPIRDKNGDPMTVPAFLDGGGMPLTAGEGAEIEPVYLVYRTKEERQFSNLGMG